MSDIKIKLERLKEERRQRSRSQKIKSSWEKIESEHNLSTKEKLEQLIQLHQSVPSAKSSSPQEDPQLRPDAAPYHYSRRCCQPERTGA